MAETYGLREPGIVSDYVTAALDRCVEVGSVRRINLADPAKTDGPVYQIASVVRDELAPLRACNSKAVDMHKELLGIVRTPGDHLLGLVDVEYDLLGPDPIIGKMVVELGPEDGDAAAPLGELYTGEEGMVVVQHSAAESEDAPEWQVTVGMAELDGRRQIIIGHVGAGITSVYRANPDSEHSFASDVPLEPRVWSPRPDDVLATLYQ